MCCREAINRGCLKSTVTKYFTGFLLLVPRNSESSYLKLLYGKYYRRLCYPKIHCHEIFRRDSIIGAVFFALSRILKVDSRVQLASFKTRFERCR